MLSVELRAVDMFHNKFNLNQQYNEKPGFLENSLAAMRINFMFEELKEYAAACGFGLLDPDVKFEFYPEEPRDLSKALDGLIDLNYVQQGTVLFHGFGGSNIHTGPGVTIWDAAFDRVHSKNMEKVLAGSVEESKNSTGRGHATDVIKPAGWTPATFDDLLL